MEEENIYNTISDKNIFNSPNPYVTVFRKGDF